LNLSGSPILMARIKTLGFEEVEKRLKAWIIPRRGNAAARSWGLDAPVTVPLPAKKGERPQPLPIVQNSSMMPPGAV
jgi:hypothetical protein